MTLTPQECLDISTKGILAQGGPALDPETGQPGCFYRGDGGTRCGIGFLIPDNLNPYSFNADSISSLMNTNADVSGFFDGLPPKLLGSIQDAHDSWLATGRPMWDEWIRRLRSIATEHNLSHDVIDQAVSELKSKGLLK